MELRELEVQLEQAYNRLAEATRNYRNEAMIVRCREYDLEGAKLALYREGKIDGKNQVLRNAQISEILGSDIGRLEGSKDHEAEAYLSRELWQIRVDYLSKVLRIEELLHDK